MLAALEQAAPADLLDAQPPEATRAGRASELAARRELLPLAA
jgi:hypothetical protein